MRRLAMIFGLAVLAVTAGVSSLPFARAETPMVFDDQAYHPNMLRPGTAEYDYALKRQGRGAQAKPAADPARLDQAMERCGLIALLSQATREKCEIRAHQAALP